MITLNRQFTTNLAYNYQRTQYEKLWLVVENSMQTTTSTREFNTNTASFYQKAQ